MQPFIKSAGSVDLKATSTALLQVLDGILLVPAPLPRDLCAPLPVLELQWTVKPDPSHVVESFPSVSPLVCVKGILLNAIKLRRPVRAIMLSYRIRHVGPLEEGESKDNVEIPAVSSSAEIRIDRQGKFEMSLTLPPLHVEGLFIFEAFLKCQSLNGCAYDMAVGKGSSTQIRIRNSRTR